MSSAPPNPNPSPVSPNLALVDMVGVRSITGGASGTDRHNHDGFLEPIALPSLYGSLMAASLTANLIKY